MYGNGPVRAPWIGHCAAGYHGGKARRSYLAAVRWVVKSVIASPCMVGSVVTISVQYEAAAERKQQGFTAVKMNATGRSSPYALVCLHLADWVMPHVEGVAWIDSPDILKSAVERVKEVRSIGMDIGVDFQGRLRDGPSTRSPSRKRRGPFHQKASPRPPVSKDSRLII